MRRDELVDRLTFGSARRRRRMQRLLAELDKLDAGGPPSPAYTRPPRPARSTGSRRSVVPAVVTAVVVTTVAVAAVGPAALRVVRPEPAAPKVDVVAVRHTTDGPPPGVEETGQPLGQPASVPDGEGGYEFLAEDGGGPVRYDPCRPLHYVIRSHGESEDLRRAVQDAVTAFSAATGLKLVFDGASDEPPVDSRDAYQPERYGARWAPLLIAFSDPDESPALRGDVAGDGGSTSVDLGPSGSGPDVPAAYVSGQVRLDARQLDGGVPFERRAQARGVIEHELGHVAGLDHIDDDHQLMYPTSTDRTEYGPGDLRGLALLGRGQCRPDL